MKQLVVQILVLFFAVIFNVLSVRSGVTEPGLCKALGCPENTTFCIERVRLDEKNSTVIVSRLLCFDEWAVLLANTSDRLYFENPNNTLQEFNAVYFEANLW